MLGHKDREFKPLPGICLEDLVPEDNFYRQVERSIDLSFARELADKFYSSIGRPSVDPLVFFKLQLIAFFEGIRSERKLMETVSLNLAHRWFIGYDLDEPVPDHSSLSKIRERFGLDVFQRFFEHIVELCIEAGLVWGQELYFDSTKVQANANVNRMIDRAKSEAEQHLNELFEEDLSPCGRWRQSPHHLECVSDARFDHGQHTSLRFGGLGPFAVEDPAKAGCRGYQIWNGAQYCGFGRTRDPSLSAYLRF